MNFTTTKTYDNWLTLLEEATTGKLIVIGSREHSVLKSAAAGWPTCACGQLCQTLPRDSELAPTDRTLRRYGMDFAAYISHGAWNQALLTFKKIEARSALLLLEQERKEQQAKEVAELKAKADAAAQAVIRPRSRRVVSVGYDAYIYNNN